MMVAKDFRQAAWNRLSGKWETAILIMLLYTLIVGAVSAATFYFGSIVSMLVSGPLMLGITGAFLNLAAGRELKIENMFDGFKKNFLSAFLVQLINGILIFLWSLLLIIPGIIKTYSYSMSYYVLVDNPKLSANEARKKSMEIMQGNKWRLFCLHFSFIGWILLSILTFGILFLFVSPYMQAAEAEFYRSLVPERKTGGVKGDPFDEGDKFGGGTYSHGDSDGSDDSERIDEEADSVFGGDSHDSHSGGSRTDEAADAIFGSNGDRTDEAADAIFGSVGSSADDVANDIFGSRDSGDSHDDGHDDGDNSHNDDGDDRHNRNYGYEYDSHDDDDKFGK